MYNRDKIDEFISIVSKAKDDSVRRILRERALEIIKNCQCTPEEEIEKSVTEIIVRLGIPANLIGYCYLREAILIMIADTKKTSAYLDIAEKYKTTSSNVENSIQDAIDVAWTRGDLEISEKTFGYPVLCSKEKPTSRECIEMIIDYIQRVSY